MQHSSLVDGETTLAVLQLAKEFGRFENLSQRLAGRAIHAKIPHLFQTEI